MIEKILEPDSLISSLEERSMNYKSLESQFIQLKTAFQGMVDLDSFKGRGADSIKRFYQAQIDVVNAWLMYIDVQIAFLDDIPKMLEDHDLSEEAFVQVPFLENDLKNAYNQANDMVKSQQESLQSIYHSINDILPLKVFSRTAFNEQMKASDNKRQEIIEDIATLDERLLSEYGVTEGTQNYLVGLFSALLNATEQGGTISPINFNSHAYHNSEVYKLKGEAESHRDAYLDMKDQQNEHRRIQKEMEEMENRPWYKKAWDTTTIFIGEFTGYYDMKRATEGIDPITGEKLSEADRILAGTFAAAGFIPVVGWAGRAAKGGKAIYSTAKGTKAVATSLNAYQYTKSFDILHKTEYGIYGLASANGFSEYITGKDMFGNELSDEKRDQSLTEALFTLGIGGLGVGFDRISNGAGISRKMEVSKADRRRLEGWDYPPSDALYLSHKKVYDNPKYFDQKTGQVHYPGTNGDPNINGFVNGEFTEETLKKGTVFDRYGDNAGGQYFSPDGSSFESRALPPFMKDKPYERYEILVDFKVRSGEIAPWFDEAGGGIQYYTKIEIVDMYGNPKVANVASLLEEGYIKIIE